MPNVPTSVWEQVPVIVIFAFLLAGIGWLFVKSFKDAISEINKFYANVVEKNNLQWQLYFDARSQTSALVNGQIVEKLQELTKVIENMSDRFNAHDLMERQALDEMSGTRKLTKKP